MYVCKKPLKERRVAKLLAFVNGEFDKFKRQTGKRVAFRRFTLDLLG